MKKEDKKKKCWETGNPEDCGPRKNPPIIPPVNKKQFNFSLWYFLAVLLGMMVINNYLKSSIEEMVDYSSFKQMIKAGQINKVRMTERFYYGKLEESNAVTEDKRNKVFKTVPVPDASLIPMLDSLGISYSAKAQKNSFISNFLLGWVVPILIMLFIWRLVFSRMGKLGPGVMSFGQNKAQLVAEGDVKTKFSDVAGADEAKEELVEVVDFLKAPQKYTEIGGKIPKGVLLVGPPGGGKTLMARAVAGQAGVTFFRMSGADFVEMFVGLGAARVRDLFKQAREKAPCIIFIDELDAIGKSRVSMAGGNDEREQTLNQLLVEMDGFDSRTGVILLAATNRPEVLDPALLRPGRFDRQVLVDRPDLDGREAILNIHAKEVKLDKSVDLRQVAKSTPGFVGADLANIVNEAALLAVRDGRNSVGKGDFEEAIEKVMAGLQKKNRLINPKEKKIVAYHETGHALVAFKTPGADPVTKISIVPRGMGALGYTIQIPTEDKYLLTREELLGKIDVLMGGRAAEEIIFGSVSTGAANDLIKATEIARKMITDYGMSEKFKNVSLQTRKGPGFLGDTQGIGVREYAESTQQYIDQEISTVIAARYSHIIRTLEENRNLLEKVAGRLLEKEVLDSEAFAALVSHPAGNSSGKQREPDPIK